MKVVDKYELAKHSNGTPFYELNRYGYIVGGLHILDGSQYMSIYNGKPVFNGVTHIEPDFDLDNGCREPFEEGSVPLEMELFNVDDDSNDYCDLDRFLVLSKKDFKVIVDYLKDCYNKLEDQLENGYPK